MTIKEFLESTKFKSCLVTPFTTVEDAETFISNAKCFSNYPQYFEEHRKFPLSKGKIGMVVYIYNHGTYGVTDIKILDNEHVNYHYLTSDNSTVTLLQKLNKGH